MEACNNRQVSIKVGVIINQGWELTKKYFPAFFLVMILGWLVSSIYEIAYYGPLMDNLLEYRGELSDEQMVELLLEEGKMWNWIGWLLMFFVVAFLVSYYLSVVTYRMMNTAIQGEKIDLTVEFKNAYRTYWFFIGTYLVYSLIVVIGSICCVLPGIYLAVRLMFVPMIAANHSEVSFNEVFEYSWKITEGHFWKLLWLFIVTIGIYVLGLICCCVGVIVSIILGNMMYACVYKLLASIVFVQEEQTDVCGIL